MGFKNGWHESKCPADQMLVSFIRHLSPCPSVLSSSVFCLSLHFSFVSLFLYLPTLPPPVCLSSLIMPEVSTVPIFSHIYVDCLTVSRRWKCLHLCMCDVPCSIRELTPRSSHQNLNQPKPLRHASINHLVGPGHVTWVWTCGYEDFRSCFWAVMFGSTLGTYCCYHPLTTVTQNRRQTFIDGPFCRGVNHMVPGAIAVMCSLS